MHVHWTNFHSHFSYHFHSHFLLQQGKLILDSAKEEQQNTTTHQRYRRKIIQPTIPRKD